MMAARFIVVREPNGREVERHNVTRRAPSECERLRATLEIAYPDRRTFRIEEEQRA